MASHTYSNDVMAPRAGDVLVCEILFSILCPTRRGDGLAPRVVLKMDLVSMQTVDGMCVSPETIQI